MLQRSIYTSWWVKVPEKGGKWAKMAYFLYAIIVYICAILSPSYIYRYKKKVKKVCKFFGILEIITTFASGNGYIV